MADPPICGASHLSPDTNETTACQQSSGHDGPHFDGHWFWPGTSVAEARRQVPTMTPERIAQLRRSAAMAATVPSSVVHELLDEVERVQAVLRGNPPALPSDATNEEIDAAIAARIEALSGGRLAQQLREEGQILAFLDGEDIVVEDPDGTRTVVGRLGDGPAVAEAVRLIDAARSRLVDEEPAVAFDALVERRHYGIDARRRLRAWLEGERSEGRLVAVAVDETLIVPQYQLDESLQLDDRAAQINARLHAAGISEWATWDWWTSQTSRVEARPVDLLEAARHGDRSASERLDAAVAGLLFDPG